MSNSGETNHGSKAATAIPRARPTAPSGDAFSQAAATAAAAIAGRRGPPPVDLWNPPYCGDLDIRIARDGGWSYLGSPIERVALARLFGSVLRKDADGRHYLVTPVEKIGITVEDVAFIGVDVDRLQSADGDPRAQTVSVRTNHDDVVAFGTAHPLRAAADDAPGDVVPYILVRGRLEARLDRKAFQRLVALCAVETRPEGPMFGFWSNNEFFALCDAAAIGEDPKGPSAAE